MRRTDNNAFELQPGDLVINKNKTYVVAEVTYSFYAGDKPESPTYKNGIPQEDWGLDAEFTDTNGEYHNLKENWDIQRYGDFTFKRKDGDRYIILGH